MTNCCNEGGYGDGNCGNCECEDGSKKGMKIFEIGLKKHDYDEYDGFVVIAPSVEEAFELCGIKEKGKDNLSLANVKSIDAIGDSYEEKARMVLGSFNAG